jgi:hypothetical protein
MLPTEKSVSAVTAAPVDRTPTPDSPVHIEPSGKITAAEMPGKCPFDLMALRVVWSVAAVLASR